jgi:hypothetical protein
LCARDTARAQLSSNGHHPVDPKALDLRDQRYQWHRWYKIVSLKHVNRDLGFFLLVAACLVSGHQHTNPIRSK